MRSFQQISELRTYLRSVRKEGKSVGFVPTMGALHAGHLSLIRRCKTDCDVTVLSLFVNPTQFDRKDDFELYPRQLNHDQTLAANEGVDAIFLPTPEEIYLPGFQTTVTVNSLTKVFEGSKRPGHFEGVATIVTKLFNIVSPDRAYFGQKDYQQLLVIERMTRDLNLPITIVPVPTLREPDGLAMSSRNVRLSPEERTAALSLHKALRAAADAAMAGVIDVPELTARMEAVLKAEPKAVVDYAVIVNPETLEPIVSLKNGPGRALLAVQIGAIRLIDNMVISLPQVQESSGGR